MPPDANILVTKLVPLIELPPNNSFALLPGHPAARAFIVFLHSYWRKKDGVMEHKTDDVVNPVYTVRPGPPASVTGINGVVMSLSIDAAGRTFSIGGLSHKNFMVSAEVVAT